MKRLIKRASDGCTFVTAERLGSGLLAVVYAAEDTSGVRVAAKLPAPNLPADQFKRFQEEYDLLTRLHERTHSVPMAWWGSDEDRDNILLLEMAPDDKLSEQLQEVDGWQREELALKAAVQYASLLHHLHTVGDGHTCADRKMGDLRWDSSKEGQQLMVLDWNAVRPQNESGVREDINIFAALWYQLLTDRYAGSDLRLLDDSAWKDGQVSIGTRIILLRAFSSGYENAAQLENDLRDWLNVMQKSGEDLHQLGMEALSKAKAADTAAQARITAAQKRQYTADVDIPPLDLDEENNALRYLDIARKKWIDALDDYKESLRLVQDQGKRLVANVALAFEITQYELAEQAIEWANRTLHQVKQLPTVTTKLHLRVTRWQLLFHIGLTAIDKTDISLRHDRKSLADAVRQLDAAEAADKQRQIEEWEDAQSSVNALINTIGMKPGSEPITDLLNLYILETECRLLFLNAEEDTAHGKYEKAINALNAIAQKLAVEQDGEEALAYVTALQDEDAFTDIDERVRQLRYKERTAVISQQLIADTSDITVPVIFVMQRLEEGGDFFADDLDEWGKIEVQNKLSAIRLLEQLKYHQQTEQWQELINVIGQLIQKYPSDEQVRTAVYPSIQKTVQHIKELTDSQKDDLVTIQMADDLNSIRQIWRSQMPANQSYSGA